MDIRPILSTLRRHKTAAALIVLEIALSCAIICNAVFLISERLSRMHMSSGVAEDAIVSVSISGIGNDDNAAALTREDLAALRAIPGVAAASVSNQVPFGHSSWNSSVSTQPNQRESMINAAMYLGSEDLVETLGVRIVAGRDFQPAEYVDFDPAKGFGNLSVHSVLITRGMAEKLFPGKNAVGQVFYMGDDQPITVVGVIDRLVRPFLPSDDSRGDYSMMFPLRMPYSAAGSYLLRTTPDQRERVLKEASAALEKNDPNRLLRDQKTLSQVRDEFFRQDKAMAWLLGAVCIALLVVTALGIVGLASFWVQQRTKQIGVRRALGATRGQVLRYFQTENFLLATLGIVLGMFGAYGINQLLMGHYELPRLPALYLPAGALALWLLGQVSVLGPARRAAAVPPAVATRSV
ncbi:MAG TPA: FtsX-like permease family protein [Xanthomonadaceae bacterium]|nr:FtsX-like permease family protein [Xanthomonadaceae bacterium]